MEKPKIVIFAGGQGTRLREETEFKPKPMVLIGSKPLIWHIMKIYETYGYGDFVIALGYKGDMIKQYFLNYLAQSGDITVDIKTNTVHYHDSEREDFRVTLVDTGLDTMTAGRLKRLEKHLGGKMFMATYGDGVADIDIGKLMAFHKSHGKLATVTGVRPSSRYGELNIKDNTVLDFHEKPQVTGSYINGGFFVFEPGFFKYLKDDDTIMLEKEPLETISKDGHLMIYKHDGFWKCVDTYKDYLDLNKLWENGAPWAVWKKKK